MMSLNISRKLLEETLDGLKSSKTKEKVILFLGKRSSENYTVEEIFTPIQVTASDYFEIPPEGMDQLMKKIKSSRRILVAQIHTHPGHAYHSMADDKWAILRHEGAYSLVLPYFCSTTNIDNFLKNVAAFTLDRYNKWIQIENSNIVIYE
jgi:proteasome lid subunit RPN8/RPN11